MLKAAETGKNSLKQQALLLPALNKDEKSNKFS